MSVASDMEETDMRLGLQNREEGRKQTVPQVLQNRRRAALCTSSISDTPNHKRADRVLLSLWVITIIINSYQGAVGDCHMGSGYRNKHAGTIVLVSERTLLRDTVLA